MTDDLCSLIKFCFAFIMVNFSTMCFIVIHVHACHKLWTEICEIRHIFKGDLIKFCEIFIKITLNSPKVVKSLCLNERSL